MYIYSETFRVVVYIPFEAKAGDYSRLQIWYLPGCEYEQVWD